MTKSTLSINQYALKT